MLRTRGDLLKYALADALKRAAKIVRGLRAGLTVSEREAVAEQAVAEIRSLPDDPWKLKDELQHDWDINPDLGASTPDDWHKPK
jgi:hypothetical protein